MYRRLSRRLLSLLTALALLGALACPALAEGEDTTPVTVTGVTLDKATLTFTALNGTGSLTATVEPENAANKGVTWHSSNTSVATVTDSGATATVTPRGYGSATITATTVDGGKTATCTVTVFRPAATGIALDRSVLTLDGPGKTGDTGELNAVLTPADADLTNVTWSSGDADVASVSPAAGGTVTVTAKAPGETTVTASVGERESGGYEAVCAVTVSGVTLSKSTLTLVEGYSETLSASSYGSAKTTSYQWTSSTPGVARVDAGKVTALSEGDSLITVTAANGYQETCTLRVTPNLAQTISAQASSASPLPFSGLVSEIDAQCRSVLGASLDRVAGLSVPTRQGILLHKYVSADNPGAGVATAESYYVSSDYGKRLSDVTFVPATGFSGGAEISYAGYAADGRSFKGVIRVEVEKTSDVVYSTGLNTPVDFSVGDFNAVCRSRTSRDLSYVSFTLPAESRGTLYYKYASGSTYNTKVDEASRYGRTSVPYLSDISFVPAQDYAGTLTIPYTCWDTSGASFGGRLTITVARSGSTGGGDVNYATAKNKAVSFRSSDFNDACRAATGAALERVRFEQPASGRGTLYYNYSASSGRGTRVSESTSYYRTGSPSISDVSFAPADGYEGTVSVPFTGWDDDGERFTGVVEIDVGSGGDGLSYSTAKDVPVDFSAADFNALCRERTGATLERVRFELPGASRGTLYYGYSSSTGRGTRVSASTSYYRSGSPSISDVTFVPADGYEGTVTLSFTGWADGGERFDGTVEVTVGSGASGGAVRYSTAAGRAVAFKPADFNAVSQDATGRSLDYVRFELPSASRGTLYYNYSSGSGSGSRVADSTRYYRSGSPSLSGVSFVPADGYEGTVSIPFTGYDTGGARVEGTVEVSVGVSGGGVLRYSVVSGKSLPLEDADLSDLCRAEAGGTLRYVRFTLPAADRGVLYYNYTGSDSEKRVSASTSYYLNSSPYLSRVSFVPAAGYTGLVSVPFTGYNTSGGKFEGSLEITVEPGPSASVIRYATGASPVRFELRDFTAACDARGEGSLVSVRFTLPSAGLGRLYYGYSGPSRYEGVVGASLDYGGGDSRSLSQISFLPNANFGGTATIAYVGTDSDGASYEGRVEISVSPAAASAYFTDLGGYAWAAASVDFLRDGGIVTGSGGGAYSPGAPITRGDFILMLHRAFHFTGGEGASFSDVPAGSYYAQAIAAAKAQGIAQGGSDGRFRPSDSLTRQDAAVLLQRAMRSVGWSLSDGTAASLSGYPDGASVAPYAVGAVGCMAQFGVLKGDGAGRLNPGGALSRGEMAVILHRALTL